MLGFRIIQIVTICRLKAINLYISKGVLVPEIDKTKSWKLNIPRNLTSLKLDLAGWYMWELLILVF